MWWSVLRPPKCLNRGFIRVGRDFPVFLHPETKQEYALARKEIKTGSRHTDFRFIFDPSVTLEEDLERRDFTCNALAFDPKPEKSLILSRRHRRYKKRILRHIHREHFQEDPLRILRLCRFAAQLDYAPAPETMELVTKMTAGGMLDHLTPERVWKELEKRSASLIFRNLSASPVNAVPSKRFCPRSKSSGKRPNAPIITPKATAASTP